MILMLETQNLITNTFLLILAILLSSIIGIEREFRHKPAGLRTHVLVCLGSCLLILVSTRVIDNTRVIQGIVTGIGFVGAGTIIAQRKEVIGITTAASIFFVAVLGIIIGFGEIGLAFISTILALLVLKYFKIVEEKIKEKSKRNKK